MHILILNHNFRGHGTYWRALQFARQLHQRGHEISMFCVASDKRYRARRCHAERFTLFETPHWAPGLDPQEGWGPLDAAFRIAQSAKQRVDLAYSFSHKLNCTAPARAARLRSGCPWLSDWCDWWGGPEGLFHRWVIPSDSFGALPAPVRAWRRLFFKLEERREEQVRHSADLITVICSALAERARQLGTRPERVLHIPSGAPTDAIQPGDKREARRRLGLDEKSYVIGYMANVHLDEDLLLGAFAKLLEGFPEATLLVIGPEFDHPRRFLSEEAQRRSVRELGSVPFADLPTPLAASDVLLMPLSDCHYNHGRWPNKIGDYVAAGRPIVATDVGDAPALVGQHEIGWVGPPTPEGLALALAEAWDNRDSWDERGRRARHVAETTLSWSTLTDRLIDTVHERLGLNLRHV